MRRRIPLIITFVIGIVLIIGYFVTRGPFNTLYEKFFGLLRHHHRLRFHPRRRQPAQDPPETGFQPVHGLALQRRHPGGVPRHPGDRPVQGGQPGRDGRGDSGRGILAAFRIRRGVQPAFGHHVRPAGILRRLGVLPGFPCAHEGSHHPPFGRHDHPARQDSRGRLADGLDAGKAWDSSNCRTWPTGSWPGPTRPASGPS